MALETETMETPLELHRSEWKKVKEVVRRRRHLMRRGLGAGVGGSNPGRGIIPLGLGKEFATNFLPQVTALWRWTR